jgi:phosphorylcholine metabolism protein LicD
MNRNNVSINARIFDSRFVNEIKNLDIDKEFKKSRLIVQAFDDSNKNLILTQSSIIQQVIQRLIVCLIATFSKMKLYLRDIIQAYVQSTSNLNRDFYIRSSHELIILMRISSTHVLKIMKFLYDVLETNNH